jgi:hypothetical protein
MLFELHDEGDAALDHADRNSNDLSDYYEKHYLIEAEYVDGQMLPASEVWQHRKFHTTLLSGLTLYSPSNAAS